VNDHDEAVALHRYALIAEAVSDRVSPAERGALVRDLARLAHPHPDGGTRTYSRGTFDRWIRAYRAEGLAGLRPAPRSDAGGVRRNPGLIDEACALRAELPTRSAAQIAEIVSRRHGIRIAERTVAAHLRLRGLSRAALGATPRAFGRYEASRPNERWITDVLVGGFVPYPRVARSRRARLFLIVDDHSRLLVHGRWVNEENTRAGQDVFRAAIERRGLPEALYADNGAPFANAALERTCAVLGVRLIHSKPYSPQGRGKQERLNRYIRDRFLSEAEARGISSLDELNDTFMAWAEQVCNTRVHAETDQTPIARFTAGGTIRAAARSVMADAFRWSALRKVTKTATVSLAGNRYSVDAALVGRKVELRYDPEDLTRLDVIIDGHPAGAATPFILGRHVHPAVPQAARQPARATGIDYLGMVQTAHEAVTSAPIAFRHLTNPDSDGDGDGDQLELFDTDTVTDIGTDTGGAA
jgi:putative transposase